jgi:predicted nucleic acid-binding protein
VDSVARAVVQRQLLLDTTFISDLDSELTNRHSGPARRFARQLRNARVFVSVVTVEEFYEKRDRESARELAAHFAVLGLHVADALRCGLLQTRSSRRLSENDAWLAAQALRGGLELVTRDRRFDNVRGLEIVRY